MTFLVCRPLRHVFTGTAEGSPCVCGKKRLVRLRGRAPLRRGAKRRPQRAPKRGRPPGRPIDYGKRWRARAAEVRARDSYSCRIDGFAVGMKGGHVDHVVPRRLCRTRAEADDPRNLACLCDRCHAHKTQHVEPRLYGGRDLQPFHRYLDALARTGPVPPAELVGAALERAARALRSRA